MRIQLKEVLLIALLSVSLCACGSSEPCESCNETPTKAYENKATNENEYYCNDCASDCEFCSEVARNYYTSGFEEIVFVCDDCYEDILEFNK